jgi:predicted RNase H-like HicB family nuclease
MGLGPSFCRLARRVILSSLSGRVLVKTSKEEQAMHYRVVLVESEEGFAVSCPALKGCHSQGATREEALRNIREAIQEWLAAEKEEKAIFTIIEDEVVV